MATGWERLATFEGGSVADLAAAQAADGSWHVFAATAVGVFRSLDRGQSWNLLLPAVAAVEVVAPSPTFARDSTIYLGAASGLHRWDGRNGQLAHLLSGGPVQTIAVTTADAADATVFVGTEHDGILISRDGGRTWDGANAGLHDLCVEGIALSPTFNEDGVAFAATADGLYRTRNGGEAWRALGLDLDEDDVLLTCVVVSPTFGDDRIVLAGTEDYGLLRSDDGGRSWTRPPELADHLINRVTYLDGGRAIVALDAGLALSHGDGQTWRKIGGYLGGVAAGALISGDTPVLLVALPESGAPPDPEWPCTGVARSMDGGETWDAPNVGLTTHLLAGLTLVPDSGPEPAILVTSLQRGLLVSRDAGRTWGEAFDVSHIAVSQTLNGESRVFALTDTGLYVVDFSGKPSAGFDWQPVWPDAPESPPRLLSAAPDAPTIAVSHESGSVTRSQDGGLTWEDRAAPPGEVATIGLAVSSSGDREASIYVTTLGRTGASGLSVWRAPASAGPWRLIYRAPDIQSTGAVTLLPMPANSHGDSVVLAIGGQVLRPRPNAWETRAGVRRPVWDAATLTDDANPDWSVNIAGLAASPAYAQDRTLFAATSAGIFVSRDGAATWNRWSDGLEPTATVAVAVSPAFAQDRLVYALGLGGSVWRRQDR